MKKSYVSLLLIVTIFFVAGCNLLGMTEEDKAKVNELKSKIQILDASISEANDDKTQYGNSLIGMLINSRLEYLKLTRAIIEQHIAALESGAKVVASINASVPDNSTVSDLDVEIANIENNINNTKNELNQYAGSLIGNLVLAKQKTYEMTLAMAQQKRLAAKYGLSIPNVKIASYDGPQNNSDVKKKDDVMMNPEQIFAAEDKGPFDFRRTRWGMSKNDVKLREDSKLEFEKDDVLLYESLILSMKVKIYYIFVNDRLVRSKYIINEEHSNKNENVDDFFGIVDDLKNKYGKPTKQDTYNKSRLYKDYDDRGMAYATGGRATFVEWNTNETTIIALLTGDKFEIQSEIEYTSKKLGSLEDAAREKKKNDAL